jgi:L-threonate 2-dehydrogenase
MKGQVGFVGLGIMGGAMARNVAAAGWEVFGYDPDADRCAQARAAGVTLVADAAEVARRAPLVVTSLPSPAAALATAEAIAGSGAAPRIVAEASTLALEDKLAFAKVLEAAGHRPLDCPLSGTGAQCERKDVVVYASGERAAIEAARPAFADFTRVLHDLGAYGNGTRMKFVANLLVAIHNVASAEAMVLGMKAGLDPHQIVELIGSGVGTSKVFDLRAPLMADDHYEPPTMKVAIWQKDMAVIGKFAAELGVETPTFAACGPIYDAAMKAGLGPMDTAAVCRVIAERSGLERETSTHKMQENRA